MAKKLRWTDVHDIAIELEDTHPDVDVVNLRFTDLWKWVQDLPAKYRGDAPIEHERAEHHVAQEASAIGVGEHAVPGV